MTTKTNDKTVNYILTRPFMRLVPGTPLRKQIRKGSAYFQTDQGEVIFFAGEQRKYTKPVLKNNQ
jgi:hypothetical protein